MSTTFLVTGVELLGLTKSCIIVTVMEKGSRSPAEFDPLADARLDPVNASVTQGDQFLGSVAIAPRVEDVLTTYGARLAVIDAVYDEMGTDGPVLVAGGLVEELTTQAQAQREALEAEATALEAMTVEEFDQALGEAELRDAEPAGAEDDLEEVDEQGVDDEVVPEAEVVVGESFDRIMGGLLLFATVEAEEEGLAAPEDEMGADVAEGDPTTAESTASPEELDDLAVASSERTLGSLGVARVVIVGGTLLRGETLAEAQEFDLAAEIEEGMLTLMALVGLRQREEADAVFVG